MERGTTKKSTWLVNDTPVALHLYYVTSNNNSTFRKTLHPKPSVDSETKVDFTSTATRVTTVHNGMEQVGDINTYIEEFDSNNTYARLRLWYDKQPVISFDTDNLIDNSVIRIYMPSDGSFTHSFTPR